MKAFNLALMFVLAAGPASAQAINMLRDKPPMTEEERAREKAVEDAYKAKMNEIPDQKASSDPWGNVRSAPSAKNTQTTKKPNPK
ncbi:MAG: hypothetical protein ACXWK2_09440 [Rhizomicrobium sp.]